MILGDVSLFVRVYPPDRRKRDLDNLLKPIQDCLSGMIFKDDSQIIDLRITKFEVKKPGRIEVMVSKVKK